MRHCVFILRWVVATWLTCGFCSPQSVDADDQTLRREFQTVVRPFLQQYCVGCHNADEPEAMLDLTGYASHDSVLADLAHWEIVLKRLRAGEMPPEDAVDIPADELRKTVVAWIDRVRRHEASRNAGDPGPVLARRLSNAEYDYSIQDLTDVDIQPTREFPVDPANQAGFDNSGESLTMSPALLNKYLAAAQRVADHLVLLPRGLTFAPHAAVIYSDRDKFCTHRIVDFYQRQPTDFADYFLAAWRYQHRDQLGMSDAGLEDIAKSAGISPGYLDIVWTVLTDSETDVGPIAELRAQWLMLPSGDDPQYRSRAPVACVKMRDWLVNKRQEFIPDPGKLPRRVLNRSSQPLVLWINRQIAANRRRGRLPESDDAGETKQLREAIERFCRVFPDLFYLSERGRMFLPPEERNKGRLLSAGFHLQLGYFRDDAPLYDLILNDQQRETLDQLWRELDFVTEAPIRQFSDYVYFERAESGFLRSKEFAFAREDVDVTSEAKMQRLARLYLQKARASRLDDRVVREIDFFYQDMSAKIRRLEKEKADAERTHLEALCSFAARAWQRYPPDSVDAEIIDFYRTLRDQEGLGHEDAVRDTLVSILVSPRFCYRVIEAQSGAQATVLSDAALASRLSYFLWSSLPDAELIRHAQAGDLHEPEILLAQTRRMLRDRRSRRLATEFGGNWLDVRRFEAHSGVNRDRFANFTGELRQAMYEEPIRFFTDLIQRNGSIIEFLEAKHTFVNAELARHYGVPFDDEDPNGWIRLEDADRVGRGGLLPMSVFLTKNSPGLRTSPVKRGYWVVRRLLGEHIPPPPPDVPELPQDEAQLGDLSLREVLAKHRESKSCAGCHQRFDSIGLVFEGYGPIGELRERDLGGRPVDTAAIFPDGSAGLGLSGLRRYLRESRQHDFVDNLGRKLMAYALGRSLLLSDESTIQMMQERLAASEYRFHTMVEAIVTSPQFLRTRGRDYTTSP